MIAQQWLMIAFLLPAMTLGLALGGVMLWLMWRSGWYGPRPSFYDHDWPGDIFADAIEKGMNRAEAHAEVKRRDEAYWSALRGH